MRSCPGISASENTEKSKGGPNQKEETSDNKIQRRMGIHCNLGRTGKIVAATEIQPSPHIFWTGSDVP
jgi:hypothetical protein